MSAQTTRYPDGPPGTIADGAQFEDFAKRALRPYGIVTEAFGSAHYQLEIGESAEGVEFKLDKGCTKYGHLSIEVEEKTRADQLYWTKSGIWRNDNTWLYVQGNHSVIYVFARTFLRAWEERRKPAVGTRTPTIRSWFLDLKVADRCCALRIDARSLS